MGLAAGLRSRDEEDEPRIVGLEPNRTVATELRLTTAEVRRGRDQGLTTILVAPTRGLFRGLSALVPLRDDTATRWIVKSPVALHIGYQTVPGQYPGSLLGVIAYQRQAFYDAQRHAQLMERYKNNPAVKGIRMASNLARMAFLSCRRRVPFCSCTCSSLGRLMAMVLEPELAWPA